jgi:membrane-associated protease RseP (regulator of RpoE activity)
MAAAILGPSLRGAAGWGIGVLMMAVLLTPGGWAAAWAGLEPTLPRPRLGVQVIPLEKGLARYFDTAPGSGMLITAVSPEGPAADAGLEPGDVILAIKGQRATSFDALEKALIASAEEEAQVTICYLRDGHRRETEVTLSARPRRLPPLGLPRWRVLRGPLSWRLQDLQHEADRYRPVIDRELYRLRKEVVRLREELEQLLEEVRRKTEHED